MPDFIAQEIDLNKVRIIKKPWTIFTLHTITVARGYNIYWPKAPIEARSIPQIAHLIHEMVHVWQYKHIGVGLYSWRWLDRRYRYEIVSSKRFLDYGLEQQAAIVEDAFLMSKGFKPRYARTNLPVTAYSSIIPARE